MNDKNALKKMLESKTLGLLDRNGEATDEEVMEILDGLMLKQEELRLYTVAERQALKKEVFYALRGLDVLQGFLDDPEITEIMINGYDHIFVEKKGRLERWEGGFENRDKLIQIIQKIAASCNRSVNEASPILDARINGSRVNVVLDPVALNGPIVTIRRFPEHPVTMDQMIAWGSISKEAAEDLKRLVRAGYNIVIGGGTGSGKTTFLNALSGYIPGDQRIITIEDSAELQLQGNENLVRMETRNANVEGCNAITIRDLIKTSLRMRPDRIIVGEVRGAEALDMMTAFNTGHDGSMSTAHANSTRDMLSRLETMILQGADLPLVAIRQQITSGVDILIHLGRLRDKSRKVLEISEVEGMVNGEIRLHKLYQFREDGEEDGVITGRLERQDDLLYGDKLRAAGIS